MKVFRFIVLLLLVIGALNWGLVGFFQYDLVAAIFGGYMMPLARMVYGVIGLAGVYGISFLCKKLCCCNKEGYGSSCRCNAGSMKCCGAPNCRCDKCMGKRDLQ